MKLFKYLTLVFLLLFTACSHDKKATSHICPQCYMPLPKSNINTSYIEDTYFDDIGCMILWANKNDINLKVKDVKVFSNDTKKYIDPFKASFTINEKTPMNYGFTAYENSCKGCIEFDEVIIKMLRGENMANPKIRKQILGY